MNSTRRDFLRTSLPAFGAATLAPFVGTPPRVSAQESAAKVPVRTITRGPKYHWFAYYDKLQFDPTVRYCLSNAVDFEHRSPTGEDRIEVGMVDLQDGDRWIPLGQSGSWGWQQGCMLQWVPGSKSQVIYNDREGDRFVSRVVDAFSGARQTLPHAIYSLSPLGKYAVTTDFRRINDLRPGYGYAGLPDPWADRTSPQEIGIQRIDLETGEVKMLVSLADIVDVPYPGGFGEGKHWFNHLLVSPDGKRTIFLHRWRTTPGRWSTRMFTIGLDGSGLREINPGAGMVSHFIWRDPEHILAWTRHPSAGDAFYVMEDAEQGQMEVVGQGVMTRDGHCTYLPGNRWIVNDTYPQGPQRLQEVYLYEVATGRRVSLGGFHLPEEYKGEWRCDTHPRHSPDGKWLCIDSPHTGEGRQLHLLDISEIVQG
ncbi:MAG: hypothetical protein EA381_11570 [Planctomycetaceae bacterium]|nr:MAG: hypothetical protein EA381_11570 [Planctomycetaceae bacterium]